MVDGPTIQGKTIIEKGKIIRQFFGGADPGRAERIAWSCRF
jgi:hypothetical protein